jgi:capsular exopolysaccharide synthesis family protein
MTGEVGADPALRCYLAVLRRRLWWIVGGALLGLAASLAVSFTQAKQYSATAELLVQPSGQAMGSAGGGDQPVTPTEVQTALQLVTSAPVQQAVQRRLGSHPPVYTAQVAQTDVISITAIAVTAWQAARIANTYANAFASYERTIVLSNMTATEAQLRSQLLMTVAQIKALPPHASASQLTALQNQQAVLQEQLEQLQVSGALATAGSATGGAEVIAPAQPPRSPSAPKPAQDALLGLLAGLMLGVGATFLHHNLDDAVTSKEIAEQLGGAAVLGLVPMVTSWKRRKQPMLVSASKPTSAAAESYRSLRTSLQFARQERELRSLLVTSPASSEGKTTTLANLGVAFAQAGERVVLASGDLRRPRIGQFFGLDEAVGLTTVLLGERSLEQALQQAEGHERLWVLAAGQVPPNPAELLGGRGMREVFAALRRDFDLILIDSPPVLPVTDAMVLSNYADGTLLVVAAGQTAGAELQHASQKFAQANAPIVGLVLNETTKQSRYGTRYRNGYGYGYGYAAMLADLPGGELHANGESAATSTITKRGRRHT